MGFGTDPLYKEDEDERDWGKNDPAYIEPQSDLTPIQKLLKQHHATGAGDHVSLGMPGGLGGMDQQQLREFAESIGMVDAESLDTASAEVDRLDKYRLENITEADAKRYAFTLGVQDTVRGIGQALATGEEGQYESDRQALLNHLKHRYPDSAILLG